MVGSDNWIFETVVEPLGGVTEGPVWTGHSVIFSQILESQIWEYTPSTGECHVIHADTGCTNGLALDSGGQLLGCMSDARAIARFDADGTAQTLPNRLDGRKHNMPNDVIVDSRGRIWFTDPHAWKRLDDDDEPQLSHASVLRLDPTGDGEYRVRRMTHDTRSPNGLLLSADEGTLYVAESGYEEPVRELRAYPVESDDTLGTPTTLHTFGTDARGPHRGVDGMCLDDTGCIIATAGWTTSGPGSLMYVFAPSGRVLETHPVPSDGPTNCAFGGADLDVLYVTSHEGHLFEVRNTGRCGAG